ncbi:MAG: Rab family GTPase [Promethearchaeota archaeon]
MTDEPPHNLNQVPVMKVFFSGEGGVGKTTFVERFVTGIFNPNMIMTIGVNHAVKTMKTTDERDVTLQIWDLGGEDRFRFVVQNYVKGSNAGVVAFDLSRMSSYVNLEDWLEVIREVIPDTPIFLLGMKKDLAGDSIDVANYQELITKYNLEKLILTSSRTGEGVEETFKCLADQLPAEPQFYRKGKDSKE